MSGAELRGAEVFRDKLILKLAKYHGYSSMAEKIFEVFGDFASQAIEETYQECFKEFSSEMNVMAGAK